MIIMVVFCFGTSVFEVLFITPVRNKVSQTCCGFNFLIIIVLTTASTIGSGITFYHLQDFTELAQTFKDRHCSNAFVENSFVELADQLQTLRGIALGYVVGYCLFMAFFWVFHVYRTYFDPRGIGQTIQRLKKESSEHDVAKVYESPFNAEELKKQRKILCPCIICLTNNPPPFYTICCSQPIHK